MHDQRSRLLLIEDDPGDVDLLREMLSDKKDFYFEVEWTDRLQMGLAHLDTSPVDVVLLDLTLPDSHGLETFTRVHARAPGVPVVVLSGIDDETIAVQSVREGAQDYLVKGQVDSNLLMRAISYAIERVRAEKALRESEVKYRTLVEQSLQGIAIVQHAPLQVTFINATGAAITGYAAEELLSMTSQEILTLVHPDDRALVSNWLEAYAVRDMISSNGELRIFRKDGTMRWVEYFASIVEHLGQPAIQAAFIDVSQRKAAEEQLRHNALHDALTGLPNRALFLERLEHAIRRAEEQGGDMLAVLFLDLDRFKVINDSLSHLVGDQLLLSMARRLESCVRSSDTVARLGGDEFAILLDTVQDASGAARVAERIQKELALPVSLEGHTVFTAASIGIALNNGVYGRPEDLLRDADTAMYRAKALGGECYQVFDASMHAQAVERWQLEADLRQAIERQELRVYYQPVVSLSGGQITGVEALLRWQHPKRGLMAPEGFIWLAEETGLIEPIGEWVLRTACAQARAWQQAGYAHLRVAVNVSPRQFRDPDLVEAVTAILGETSLAPESLELEITDSVALGSKGLRALNGLNAMGIHIALDDFGLGSSLNCLKLFPLNTLKIDQSFVSGMGCDSEDAMIITAVIAMARGLELKIIAEGVEAQEQLALLRSKGCDEIQGNLFSVPVSAEVLTGLLQEGRRLILD